MNTRTKERLSFVVRVWFEPTAISGSDGEWRGRITDAESLESRSFRSLTDVTTFIARRAVVADRPGWSTDDEIVSSDALDTPTDRL
ncbi:MAG TPA: hypothetical protein VMO47_05200 [Rhodothermales bacterium]|nr:hypothetical protein [Rhodothermales bacterium]